MSAAKPLARFTVRPSTPFVTDTVELLDSSTDPEHIGIAWRAWDFGDGETADGPAPAPRYETAGEYETTCPLATFDGRTSLRPESIRINARPRSRSND